jgi:hypothetical protein
MLTICMKNHRVLLNGQPIFDVSTLPEELLPRYCELSLQILRDSESREPEKLN